MITLGRLDSEQSLFSSKTEGKNAKQVTVRALLSVTSEQANCSHVHSHAHTLTCFAFFPTDFRGKEGLLAVYSSMESSIKMFWSFRFRGNSYNAWILYI